MKKSVLSLLVLATPCLLALEPGSNAAFLQAKQASSASLFTKNGLKEKVLRSAPGSSRKGTLLYGYDSGATAALKAPLQDEFTANILSMDDTLEGYTLTFSDQATSKSFSVGVNLYPTYSDVYVAYQGEKVGIHTYEIDWNKEERLLGRSAYYNQKGEYSRVASKEVTLSFNPSTMQVQMKSDAGTMKTVWDFAKEYNDGQYLAHDLTTFGEYTVTLTYGTVKPYSAASLLLYSFGGFDLSQSLDEGGTILTADIRENAKVGEPYLAPTPRIVSAIAGELDASKATLTIRNQEGDVIQDGTTLSFTPSKAGYYYLYYAYDDGTYQAHAYYRIEAKEELTAAFSYENTLPPSTDLGVHENLYLPRAYLSGEAFLSGKKVEALLTIQKDGTPIEGYQKVTGGFSYEFVEAGAYEVIYSHPSLPSLHESYFVQVREDIATWKLADSLSSSYLLGSEFDLPDVTVFVGGESLNATKKLVFPSGRVVTSQKAYLTELGNYSLVYSYEINGKTESKSYRFGAHKTNASLWSGVPAVYDAPKENLSYHGTKLTLQNGVSAAYQKVIDFRKYNFQDNASLAEKEASTPFLALTLSPQSNGTSDMTALYVVLTDVEDPNNTVEVRMRNVDWTTHAILRAKAKNQIWVGYAKDFWTGAITVVDSQAHEDGGAGSGLTFTQNNDGEDDTYEDNSLMLYWNNDKRCLYAKPDAAGLYGHNAGGKDTSITPSWLVRDFASVDPTLSAGDAPWSGFKSGKAYLSIYAKGVTSKADVFLRSVDGSDQSDPYYQDQNGPTLVIDTPKTREGTLPAALKGKPYHVYSYKVQDDDSSVASFAVRAYLRNLKGDETELYCGSSFIASEEGTVRLVYLAVDAFGNETKQEFLIPVKSAFDAQDITLTGELPTNVNVGDYVTVPTASVTGGDGYSQIRIKAQVGGHEIEIQNQRFQAIYEGDYAIVYEVTDWNGETASKTITLPNVTYSNEPRFEEDDLFLPSAFIAGQSYSLKTYTASLFVKGEDAPRSIPASVEVTDGDGTRTLGSDLVYVPKTSSTVSEATLRFRFAGLEGAFTEITKVIPIRSIKRSSGFMANYFYGNEGTNVTAKDEGVSLTATGGDTFGASFLHRLDAQNLPIRFSFENIDTFRLVLQDSQEANEKVTLSFRKKAGQLLFTGPNGTTYIMNEQDGQYVFRYLSSYRVMDIRDVTMGALETYDNGETFKGFSSGSLYFSIEVDRKSENSSFTFLSIANQTLNNIRNDTASPVLTVHGNCAGRYQKGQTITIPTATAYDVLNDIGEVKVSVSRNGETVLAEVSASQEQTFTPNDYGTYEVLYSVMDSQGNYARSVQYLEVVDDVKPTLHFTSENPFPSDVKVGDTITLPSYTIEDNGDVSKVILKLYVKKPNGDLEAVSGDTFTFEERGVYRFSYFLQDENGGNAVLTYSVTVH